MASALAFSRRSRAHYFNITYECNSLCRFCASNLRWDSSRNKKDISLMEFRSFLKILKVSTDDLIIINGGEPTIHKDFLHFLAAVSERGANRVVYSNGRAFANPSFVQKTSMYEPLELLIPIYSMKETEHDHFTGVVGSLNETLRGIDNIFILQQKGCDLFIEFRLLLSRFTAPHLTQVIKKLSKIYASQRFCFSLNPLIVSKKAFLGNHMASLLGFVPIISEVEKETRKIGRDLIMAKIPQCILWEVRPELAFSNQADCAKLNPETYIDPYCQKPQVPIESGRFAKACKRCVFLKLCPGFPSGHLAALGGADVKPITHKKISNCL